MNFDISNKLNQMNAFYLVYIHVCIFEYIYIIINVYIRVYMQLYIYTYEYICNNYYYYHSRLAAVFPELPGFVVT